MIARENPFRTERVLSVRYRLPAGGREALLDRFESMGRRAAIVGPNGSGKTTLMEDLAPALEARGYRVRMLRLDEEHRRIEETSFDRADAVLLDGAEQLERRRWKRFERETRGALLVTTHVPGLLPTLLECRTTPALLEDLVRELVGPEAEGLPLRRLYDLHRGNLREAIRSLYDLYAGRSQIPAGTPSSGASRSCRVR